jgi:hypothetical protein
MQRARHPKSSIWSNISTDRKILRIVVSKAVSITKTKDSSKVIKKMDQLVLQCAGQTGVATEAANI